MECLVTVVCSKPLQRRAAKKQVCCSEICFIAVTLGYGSSVRTISSSCTLFYLLNVLLVSAQPAKILFWLLFILVFFLTLGHWDFQVDFPLQLAHMLVHSAKCSKKGSVQGVSFSQCCSNQPLFSHYVTVCFSLLLPWAAVFCENMRICMCIMLQFAWYTAYI